VKRIIENGASHVGAAGSPRAAKGKATTAVIAAAAIGLFASEQTRYAPTFPGFVVWLGQSGIARRLSPHPITALTAINADSQISIIKFHPKGQFFWGIDG
jgi:hypothetical protein